VISLQVGDCWLWSLIIFLIHRFVSVVLGPHSLMGGVGGFPPHNYFQGGRGQFLYPPLGGGFGGKHPRSEILGKITL
jgi:hypothetical protein